ncbi:MAG: hypothetical protein E6G04_04570 [Actinobacteria bacterium]|nr:MAG: hypothetical protein E6G04_04570 [Actinomycetota bacterium]
MPGKHAPESPGSFYLSVARAVGGALVVLGVVAVIAVAATGSGGKKPTAQNSTPPPTVSIRPTLSSTPSTTVTPTTTATATNLASITVDVLTRAAAEALLAAHPELKRVAPAPASQTVKLTVVIGDDYKAA